MRNPEVAQHDEAKPAEELLPRVYRASRNLGAYQMADRASHRTLQSIAQVREAWLRLCSFKKDGQVNQQHKTL